MTDADTIAADPIRVFSPVMNYIVLVAAATVVLAFLSGWAAAPLAIFALLVPAIGALAIRAAGSVDTQSTSPARARARATIIDTVDAWPELASLGALPRAQSETERGVKTYAETRLHERHRVALPAAVVGTLTAVAFTATGALAWFVDRSTAPTLSLTLLLSSGVYALGLPLLNALRARAESVAARTRLSDLGVVSESGPQATVILDSSGLHLRDYNVPASWFSPRHQIEADIPRGGTLVLTGRSGSGKSTLLKALTHALARADSDQGRSVLVPVDDYLFTGTVLENLTLAHPGITVEAAVAALDAFGLHELHPETRIGVGGRDLSGGERSRLRSLRGALAGASVLLIDEPTAGLDAAASVNSLRALRTLAGDATLVLALHSAKNLPPDYNHAVILPMDSTPKNPTMH
jgi:ATP-binding cassette subfamily C protein CydC